MEGSGTLILTLAASHALIITFAVIFISAFAPLLAIAIDNSVIKYSANNL